jgi:hypothetical protein
MRRRDVPKVLLASLADGELSPARTIESNPAARLQEALRARGAVHVAVGTYQLTSKLQTLVQNDIAGDSRHDTVLHPSGFPDYVFEVGDGRPGPNAGRITRLKFLGAAGNLGCLHMNSLSHMWHLDDLIFQGGPCPALVVDNCWDSNYTNIDILAHVSPGTDPAKTSAVIFRNGCNNIYCRGLRIEGALSGGIYTDLGPIYVVTGKIDDGFGRPQTAAAVTVAPTGYLIIDHFYFGGMLNQFHIDVAGTLKLGRVFLDGGTNSPAAIYDRRAWAHINALTQPTYSPASGGPSLPVLDLGEAEFRRYHSSVSTETPAAVYSKIHPIRQVKHLAVRSSSSSSTRGNTIDVATSLRDAHKDLYKSSFLVHNATGARRRILTSSAGGVLTLEGAEAITSEGDWSIEYCETHDTPIRFKNAWLDRGQSLFATVASRAMLTGAPTYISDPGDKAYGTTKIRITGGELLPSRDLAGFFLVDNVTDAAYYIEYGIDSRGDIGLIYDRRKALNTAHEFSVVAGHIAQ